MIVFDASAVVSAALRENGVPEQALLRAEAADVFALSVEVDAEITGVLERPRFAAAISAARRARILDVLRGEAVWFTPSERVTDCRDKKDDKYLELALAAGAWAIVSGDADLLVLHPWRGVRILRPAEYLAEAGGGT
ncbi:putative toxin-antitoxin system toxin component, PIN family [Roseicella frigidaeris]|uniref:Putative toxin-antitoxin system toxin component, PIN family n=1 Tax=Roseicella frigidaeris TaxID=2230885 RepID=A0A327LVU6_9PROT|nr:putative toxin-antitoxin system toxin component, PIN family [Roseicella frigidaeris]RAI54536.1 putative toxin-antitoxin system toxin component, PIN family [Roseicella frigidaeris]